MSHPYATSEPLYGAGNDAEHVGSSVASPSLGAAPPVTATTPSPEGHADGNDNAHSAAASCTMEKQTRYDNAEVIHGSDQDDMATAVSHSPDVSSPSSSSCSAESSMPPSWLPSRSSSCSSATSSSFISASDCSSCSSGNAGLVADGTSTPESGHNHHFHQERPHHRHHPPRHCSDDRHVTDGDIDRRVGAPASRRVQTSEHTRFTSVLAGGRRCGDSDALGAAPAVSCGRIDEDFDGGSSRTQDVAWWRSCGAAAKATVGAVPAGTCDTHPYCCAPHSPQSPLQRRQRTAGVDPTCRDLATQRLSPFVTTVSGTLTASPTPLPPPHPRRSSSAQRLSSNAPMRHTPGGVPRSSKPLFANKGSGSSDASGGLSAPTAMDGSVPRQPSRSVGCVARQARCGTLRRSFSFTSGVPPVSASYYEVPSFSASRAASPVAAANSAIGAPRTLLSGERHHERTASITSSVHSASSSVRPSVPLPPSHVGIPSNMMAAMWVDLPLSQSGSRSATPLNSSDAYAPPRRRRTTPRRRSGPPSPATSTLAASVASSLDGAGYMSSATGGAPASARRLLVTVSTQTDNDSAAVEGCKAPVSLTRRLYWKSSNSPYVAKVGSGERCGGTAHQYNLNDPFESEGAALTMVASVSSTSAEVSPRSLLASVAEIRPDDHAVQAVLDADAARRVHQHIAGDAMRGAAPSAPTSLSADVATKVDHVSEDNSPSSASAEPPGAMYVYETSRVDVPPRQGGAKAAAVAVNTSAPTEVGKNSPAGALTPLTTFPLPTSLVTQPRSFVPAAPPQSQAGAPSAGGVPPPTTTAVISNEAGAHSSLKTAGEGRCGAGRGPTSVDCRATEPLEEADNPSDPQPLTPSRSDEVWRLRAELAQMRHQYEQVVQQLRQMQDSVTAAGPAAGSRKPSPTAAALNAGHQAAMEAVLVTTSPSLPAASLPSSSCPVAMQNRSGTPENPLEESASSVSSNSDGSAEDATATLDHVRAALQRARRRATN